MKYITFAIPCYNSAEYVGKCIDSLLPAKDDIEIIIVNDGSTDNTLKIANQYKKKYPNVIRVIDKKNGGHGSAVNAGLSAAKGLYFKVVDSDDHVDEESLRLVVDKIKELKQSGELVDLMISNYVYEKVGERPKPVEYKKVLPRNRVFGWDEIGHFRVSQYLLMHSMMYNTKFLRKTGLLLPEHTFYVDNIFAYYPLPKVKKMYYLDVNLYRYFIGREDQSVNQEVMVGRVDQQLFVTKQMLSFFDPYDFMEENKKCAQYCLRYINIMMAVSSILLQIEGGREASRKRKELWAYVKDSRPRVYGFCRRNLAGLCNLPRTISVGGYNIARKIYKFN